MRCANKLLVFLLILVSFIENTTAQSVTDQQQVLYLRRLQLDGKFNSEFSFQQRAFFNSSVDLPEIVQQFSFGDKIAVKGLDSNQYQLRILPIQKLDVYNTHHIVTIKPRLVGEYFCLIKNGRYSFVLLFSLLKIDLIRHSIPIMRI
jgi:hypothetical protein